MVPGRDEGASGFARSAVSAGVFGRVGQWAAALAFLFALASVPTAPAAAKTPGAVHCYSKWCHRVSTLEEMDGMVGRHGFLKTSFYDDCRVDRSNTCNLTSSGEIFRPDLADNAASPIFPDGTVLLAFNPLTQKAAVLRVNSAGPYRGDRKLDVSRATAENLGFRDKGVAELMVAVIKSPEPHEARYKKLRRYDSVPGFIGTFASFDAAHAAALASVSLAFEPASVSVARFGAQFAAIEPEPKSDFEIEQQERREKIRRDVEKLKQIEILAVMPVRIEEAVPSLVVAPVRIESVAGSPSAAELGARSAADMPSSPSPSAAAITQGDDRALAPGGAALRRTARDSGPVTTIAARTATTGVEHLWERLVDFAVATRVEARRLSKPIYIPHSSEWPGKIALFVDDARAKARASAVRSGPLYKLVAELKLKAQFPRYERN